MSIHLREGLAYQPLDHVLEDLLVRFVINVPEEDLSSIERVFFQVEEAQWFYTDFLKTINPALPNMKMKSFAPAMLKKCPLVWKWGDPLDALSRFGKYKSSIPVRGIALLNEDLTKVILVQGVESNSWSFPRGKISKDEDDLECAIREVKEETGFDARNYVNEKDVLERTIGGKNFKIFVAKGVPEDYQFEPTVRNEIANIKWFECKGLRKSVSKSPSKFYVVSAMMEPMNRWINKNKGLVNEVELKRQAEVKLKALMGIDAVPANVNVDAGRELLNILQSAKPQVESSNSTTQPPQYIQMSLPQHLQSIYSMQMGMPQMPFYSQMPMAPPKQVSQVPTFPPSHPLVHPQMHQPHPLPSSLPAPQQAFPGSLNSKELLSLLKRDPQQKTPDAPAVPRQKPAVNHGEELLKLFKKKPKEEGTDVSSASPIVRSETPSKKITLLKRDKSTTDNDASATLLGILGKNPPSPDTPKSQGTDFGDDIKVNGQNASAEFLGLLNRKPTAPSQKAPAADNGPPPDSRVASATNQSASSELLDVLKRDKAPKENESASKNLLNLLNRKPIRIAKRDEDISQKMSPLSANHTDLSSGNQILNAINKTTSPPPNNQILNTINKITSPPPNNHLNSINKAISPPPNRFTSPPVSESFQDFGDFENFEDFDEISESQNGIYNSIANTFDVDTDEEELYEPPHVEPPQQTSTNSAGAGLLLLLNGGKPPVNRNKNLQETYESISLPTHSFVPTPIRSQPSNGADLLLLLKRGS